MNDLPEKIAALIIKVLKAQLILQGHKLTGKLERSIESTITKKVNSTTIQILLNSYGIILDKGVPASRIPYNPRTRSGARTSKYIQGLKDFAKKRFAVSDREALGIAFAIAKKQAREGMPTRGSFKFSKTGKRTGFLQETIDESSEEIQVLISETINKTIEVILTR